MTDITPAGVDPGRVDPLADLRGELDALRAASLYRPLVVMHGPQTKRTTMDGRPVISLSSNNYLGLATHPHLVEAALAAVRELGVGSGAVRTIAGTMELHEELERRLAAFKHIEATLVFQSGFTANSGVIPTITGEHDLIVSDELNHASIIDGVRLSKAARAVYPAQGRRRAGGRAARRPGQGRPRRRLPAHPGHHRRRLQHGRRHRAAARDLRRRRAIRGGGDGRRRARVGRPGSQRPRHHRPLRPSRARRHPGRHALQGHRRAGRLRGRAAAPARLPHPARAAVPLLHLASAGRGRGLPRRHRRAGAGARAHRAAVGEHALLQGRP